jgi:transcriptional regulator with XRE-family HTH domain
MKGFETMINPTLMTIRTKKLGVLMRSARLAYGKSLEECAKAIGVSANDLQDYELGERAPSLPELEMLAFFLKIPLEHFWGNELLKGNGHPQPPDPQQMRHLRQRMIGALIRKARIEADLSPEALAEQTGIAAERLAAYEMGEDAIPFPELEILAKAFNSSIREFQDKNGPVGDWFLKQRTIQGFQELPAELQNFASKPVNQPYLEVAKRLSEMQVEKLRSVAEVLLEITL